MSGNVTTGINFTGDNSKVEYRYTDGGNIIAPGDAVPAGETVVANTYEYDNGTIKLPAENTNKRLMAAPGADDSGRAIRVQLVGEYAAENYGLKFRLRFDERTLGARAGDNRFDDFQGIINYAYVWSSMFNNKLKLTGGLIDNAVWKTAGDQEFHYSNGTGVRFEVTPIEGLNAGLMLNWPVNSYNGGNAKLDMLQLLTETTFGLKYSSDAVDIAAGFKLDSDADGGGSVSSYDGDMPGYYKSFVSDMYGNGSENSKVPSPDARAVYTSKKEMRAYIGANIKMVEKLSAAIEAEFYHLGAFGGDPGETIYPDANDPNAAGRVISPKGLGAIWVDEKISYAVSDTLTAGITMHQFLFGGKPAVPAGTDDYAEKAAKAMFKPEFRFQPFVEYKLNDKATANLKLTYYLKPTYYKMKLEVKPQVTYQIGTNAKMVFFYNLGIERLTKYSHPVVEFDSSGVVSSGTEPVDPKAVMSHTFQIDMIWSF